ncbi:MAG: DUF5723 family protein [Bacteroidales bacterium]|nr:DUF5723 family protein [Bacteroidales bacterium]
MRIILTIFFICNIIFNINGQEMLGVINSNYAGIYGISLNPSSMVGSKLYMDYNLLSCNMFVDNNYMFIDRSDFVKLFYKGVIPVYRTSENEARDFDIYRDKDYYHGFQNIRLTGPGGMLVYGKHAFGIFTAFRSNTFFNKLPKDMGIFLYEAIDFDEQQKIDWSHDKTIRFGSVSWFELDLSYAYNIHRYKWEYWSVGISIKPLFGISGLYSNVYNVDYFVQHDDTAFIRNLDFNYSYSLPVNYNDNTREGPLFRGFGFGVDLGVTYMHTTKGHSNKYFGKLCAQRYDDYNYKIGLSILDLGYIKFTKKAEVRSFNETGTNWYRSADTLPTGSINEINYKLDHYFSDYPGQSITDDKFVIYTPLAVSLQFDYHLNKFVYLNGTVIYGFGLGDNFVKRPSVVAFTPRYEKTRWEIAMPLSFVNWDFLDPHIGVAIRYGNFFMGMDRINSFLGFSDFSEFDFYIGLRLNLSGNLRMDYFKGNCGKNKLHNIEMFDFRNF